MAACAANSAFPAELSEIIATAFSEDNMVPTTERDGPFHIIKDAHMNREGDVFMGCTLPNVNGKPRTDLLFSAFTFDAEIHGPFVIVLAIKFTGRKQRIVTLSPAQIWQGILLWCSIAVEDMSRCTSVALGGKRSTRNVLHRPRSVFWIIPAAAHASPNIISAVNFWKSGGTAPFELVHPGSQPAVHLKKEGLVFYDKIQRTPDRQAFHWMCESVDKGTNVPRNSVFAPNHGGAYTHADFLATKVNSEAEHGVFRAIFALAVQFIPAIVEAHNVVVKDGESVRKVYDGSQHGVHEFEGAGVSSNQWENPHDLSRYKPPKLPTPLRHEQNIAIIMTLSDAMANVRIKSVPKLKRSLFSPVTGFSNSGDAYRICIFGEDIARCFK